MFKYNVSMRNKRYKFFTNSEKTWEAMYEAIAAATESVYLEMYILKNNMSKYDFYKLLKDKALSGVRVRIILDSWGSMSLGSTAIDTLRESGAELFFFRFLWNGTHRKILIIDEKRAFIGGVNFNQHFASWEDLSMEIRGKMVKYITRSFAKGYAECGGPDPILIAQSRHSIFNKTHSWLVEHFPTRKKFGLNKLYKGYLGKAKTSIILVTPYFFPSLWLVKALRGASERGGRGEILLPPYTYVPFLSILSNRIHGFYMRKLSKFGIIFYIRPKMNHSKVMLIDNSEGMVGSQNIDFTSFELNYEIGVLLKEKNIVKKLSEIVETWKMESVLFDPRDKKLHLMDYIVSPLIRLVSLIF